MVVYKTTNLLNGKIYVGKDSRNLPAYLGSGSLLNRAIEKYGVQNFVKEILDTCVSEEELNEREKFWIRELHATDKAIGYNIAMGGEGGDTITQHPQREEICAKRKETFKARNISPTDECRKLAAIGRKKTHPRYGTEVSEEAKAEANRKHGNFLKDYYAKFGHWDTGKKRTEEQKKRMSDSLAGEKHPNFGKHLSASTKESIRQKMIEKMNRICEIKIVNEKGEEFFVHTVKEAGEFLAALNLAPRTTVRARIRECLRKTRDQYKGHKFILL
jgi:group I intron endonuclease